MQQLLADTGVLSGDLQDFLKLGLSVGSFVVTVYFWFIRVNRERVAIGVYPAGGFEGTLESGGIGLWTGRVFLTNKSILATAVISVEVELWWNGRWVAGNAIPDLDNPLPWNLPPSQAFAKTVRAAFDLGPDTDREKVYLNQRLRFTFNTVEGVRVPVEMKTNEVVAKAA